ncbi:hypothetical protein LAZ67_14001830 [Cordylochernes scorpioides]|uniref:Transposase n=1 Tax=Cordylochernes scorpioides TaxID=51811 RepID=A0ABY6L764_9ARAC|nr:hypothetical protein LAZ67_14001830 [Cordylochernes scorpioides]
MATSDMSIQTSQICQRMKNIYGESCLSQKNIYKWVNEFKNGRITCTDIERPGRPSVTATPSTINAVENLILEDRKISIFTIADNLNISYGTALLKRYEEEGDHFLGQIVTGDESWCYHYDPSTKHASMEWKRGDSPRPKKIRSQRSAGKVLLTIFWDVDGPICVDFFSSRQRMNSDLYCDILVNKLKPGIRNKRGKLSKVFEHPAYSPDLAPSDYFLFGLLKKELKGKRFDSDEHVQKVVQDFFTRFLRVPIKRVFTSCQNDGDDKNTFNHNFLYIIGKVGHFAIFYIVALMLNHFFHPVNQLCNSGVVPLSRRVRIALGYTLFKCEK